MENTNGEQLAEDLRQTMQTHARLLRLVRNVDDILATHTLVRLAIAVPRTIYSIREIENVFNRPSAVRWTTVTRAVSNVLNSMIDLISLTVIPATVASEMSEAEIIVCTSEPVWKSRNDEVDRTLSLLILQLRTSRRGLSAGGLLTITNNRILTGYAAAAYLVKDGAATEATMLKM
ncbi:hypothetical protein AAVH_26271 [Aphelenchoides avenae]|nr:hypothetical protein AAVH_26271 [Aphelenchus avenae]